MNRWESSICHLNGIHLHYLRTGGDKPALVLLHGLAANGACFTGLAHSLESEYDIIMPDARGHGQSGAPENGYRYEELANDVVGLITSLKLSSPVLLGHSMGGMTAAIVAGRFPGLLRGVILADPTFITPEVQREVYDSDLAGQHRRISARPPEELISDIRKRHPGRLPEIIEILARARFQTHVKAFDILIPPNPDYEPLVRAIIVPALLIYGDSGVISPVTAKELQRLNPSFHSVMIPEAGHGLQYDQPERFAAAVQSFLHSL